jgi:hypothetical protein
MMSLEFSNMDPAMAKNLVLAFLVFGCGAFVVVMIVISRSN